MLPNRSGHPYIRCPIDRPILFSKKKFPAIPAPPRAHAASTNSKQPHAGPRAHPSPPTTWTCASLSRRSVSNLIPAPLSQRLVPDPPDRCHVPRSATRKAVPPPSDPRVPSPHAVGRQPTSISKTISHVRRHHHPLLRTLDSGGSCNFLETPLREEYSRQVPWRAELL